MTFKKKKKGSGYVVTWDSDCTNDSDDDDSSDDDKRSIKKALASITIHNKPSLFDTPSTCLMAKPTKIKYDESDDEWESDNCRSDDEKDYSKDELIEICEQLSTGYEKREMSAKHCKRSSKPLSNHLMSSKHLMSVYRKTMRSLALLTPSLKKLTPLYLSKLRRRRPRWSK
jgi:hypothetical protein